MGCRSFHFAGVLQRYSGSNHVGQCRGRAVWYLVLTAHGGRVSSLHPNLRAQLIHLKAIISSSIPYPARFQNQS
jgi:hypothetical protein